jgi:hypothetical protein
MKRGMLAFLILAGGLFASALRADVLVLIHGYLSSAQSWDASGITAVLEHAGWHRAGVFVAGPAGLRLASVQGGPAKRFMSSTSPPRHRSRYRLTSCVRYFRPSIRCIPMIPLYWSATRQEVW